LNRYSSLSEWNALFQNALESFVEKLKQDEQVIAAVLFGSLSYDQVWEKSDLDLKLIVQDQKLARRMMCFVEQGIWINATIDTRNDFKRWMERSVQSSISHSMLVRGKLLFTKDRTIEEYFEQIRHIGERDRQLQLLQLGCHALSMLSKAEKWFYVKRDPAYSAFWLIKMVDVLAKVEVVLNREVPMREAVHQAMTFHPEFFEVIYTGLIAGHMDENKVRQALDLVAAYIGDRAEELFRPILDYLRHEQDIRTITDIEEKLGAVAGMDAGGLGVACAWLADRGTIVHAPAPAKATPKSRVALEEPAFFIEPEDDYEFGA